MKGHRNGVATKLAQMESRAVYTHCYGHSLNLACQDTVRDIKVLKDALDTTFELPKFLKFQQSERQSFSD